MTAPRLCSRSCPVDFDLLLGRRTYEIWAGFWPYAGDHPVASAFQQGKRKTWSREEPRTAWTGRTRMALGGDAVDEVRRLKRASDGPELHIWGSSQLLQTLIAAELVDEFRVWVYPVVVGKGKRLFEEGVPAFGLTLVESRSHIRGDPHQHVPSPAGPLPDRDQPQPDNPSEVELARRKKLAAEDRAAPLSRKG